MDNIVWIYGLTYQILYICIFPIASLIYMLKNKCLVAILFFTGFMIKSIGTLLEKFFPLYKGTVDVSGKLISESGFPILWNMGHCLSLLGLVIVIIGLFYGAFSRNV